MESHTQSSMNTPTQEGPKAAPLNLSQRLLGSAFYAALGAMVGGFIGGFGDKETRRLGRRGFGIIGAFVGGITSFYATREQNLQEEQTAGEPAYTSHASLSRMHGAMDNTLVSEATHAGKLQGEQALGVSGRV
jgi:hypothetical protein